MRLPRASGILLHPTSLPGKFGVGDLGPASRRFVDFLGETGQSWWQILPIGPTGYGNSPYQSHSSFAGNPLLISPEDLVEDGYLERRDLSDSLLPAVDEVDYDAAAVVKDRLFRLAFERLDDDHPELKEFEERNADWIEDYSLFMALKHVHNDKSWVDWEPDVATRKPDALRLWRERLDRELRYVQFVQFLFDRQWNRLRRYGASRGIKLIGDLPIFVAQDSADVWSNPHLFELDPTGRPKFVAGVPPDYFSATGQLWGNPLYRWSQHAAEGYAWWIKRVKATLNRVDLARLDHFRGFEAYWEVPAGEPTAQAGRWRPGPGDNLLAALERALEGLPLIAEDLGNITPEVEALRDRFRLPGMRILQFAFGDDAKANDYLPLQHIPHCVVYTGTHDNDTTVGWYHGSEGMTTQSEAIKTAERSYVRRYANSDGSAIHWDMIRLALGSVADTAIIPLQDVLGLGSEARMNIPGRAEGNWRWRYREEMLDDVLRDRLAEITAVFHRWNRPIPERFRLFPEKPAPALVADEAEAKKQTSPVVAVESDQRPLTVEAQAKSSNREAS